jgi:hypothetical protein
MREPTDKERFDFQFKYGITISIEDFFDSEAVSSIGTVYFDKYLNEEFLKEYWDFIEISKFLNIFITNKIIYSTMKNRKKLEAIRNTITNIIPKLSSKELASLCCNFSLTEVNIVKNFDLLYSTLLSTGIARIDQKKYTDYGKYKFLEVDEVLANMTYVDCGIKADVNEVNYKYGYHSESIIVNNVYKINTQVGIRNFEIQIPPPIIIYDE